MEKRYSLPPHLRARVFHQHTALIQGFAPGGRQLLIPLGTQIRFFHLKRFLSRMAMLGSLYHCPRSRANVLFPARKKPPRLFPLGKAGRLSLSKKLACGDLFRQDTFPLRFQRGRGNAQGNLAAQGFRIHRTCRWIRISFGGDGGMRQPCGAEGSASPVGCCHRRWQSDPEESTETSGGRGQRPPRRLRLRVCGPPNLPEGFLTVWGGLRAASFLRK